MAVLVLKDWDFCAVLKLKDCVYLQRGGGERVLGAPGSNGLARPADTERCSLHITGFHKLNVGQQRWGHYRKGMLIILKGRRPVFVIVFAGANEIARDS